MTTKEKKIESKNSAIPRLEFLLHDVQMTEEIAEEIRDLQGNNNSAINSEIKQLDEVIDFMTSIHLHGDQVISPERLLDSIATLRWAINRLSIFKANGESNLPSK
ncbi:hypothetical protein [Sunxiuqinia dokdonensis]|uniref:Uncharacterized protein n=1 Tax=Sunxiuqinia dokdonensis TaxID=1409788 RepID=A0A0L8VF27_9BACT|nr:hypothetical protein [Sunxiuqinia dokdonensis]KOH47066.1 hypothetical protein NC99_01090 [Sunxiuqinia dokdonensis]